MPGSEEDIGNVSELVEKKLQVEDDAVVVDFTDNPLVQKLQDFGLEYEAYGHPKCMTADELSANVPLSSTTKQTHTKNVFFKDKKHGLFLVTTATSTTFNNKQLGTLLNLTGKVNMRLAPEETLMKTLQVKPGCVGPLCMINDAANEVTLVLDKALTEGAPDGPYDYIHSHPLRNDVSVKIKPAVLMEFLTKAGIAAKVVDFSAEVNKTGGGGTATTASSAAKKKGGKQQKQPKKSQQQHANTKGKTLLALQYKKEENFAKWYTDVIVLSEMISYYDISGCYILRPWSYKVGHAMVHSNQYVSENTTDYSHILYYCYGSFVQVWDLMQQWFNEKVRGLMQDEKEQIQSCCRFFTCCLDVEFTSRCSFSSFHHFCPSMIRSLKWMSKIVTFRYLYHKTVWRKKKITWKILPRKLHGSPEVERVR